MTFDSQAGACQPREENISSPEEIRRHLTELYHLQIPVNFCIDNKVELPESYLIYDDEMDNGLVVRTRTIRIQEFTDVRLSYALSSKTCHFSSKIVAQKEITQHDSLIQIEIPLTISCLEQRRYCRVTPPDADEIRVEMDLTCAGEMVLTVLNISGGGLSFLVPERFTSIQAGMTLPLSLRLSNEHRLRINSLVVNTSPFMNLNRVGVEFFDMSESERSLLAEYVLQRQNETRQQTAGQEKVSFDESKIIVIKESGGSKYDFLRERFDIQILKNPGPRDELLQLDPDIVILDLEDRNTLRFLDILKKMQSTKFFPILISGNDPKGIGLSTDSILYNPPPFKKDFVARILEDLLQRCKISKRIMEKDWREFQQGQKTVLVIGRYGEIETAYLRRLERFGYRIVIMEDEKDILTRTVDIRPDLIIVDAKLEKSDIISLCKMMSFHKVLKNIPKILVADNIANPTALYEQNIVSDMLLRPFTEQELINKIEPLTHHRQDSY